jgi:hypothetical protein
MDAERIEPRDQDDNAGKISRIALLTFGGPMMVPFHLVIVISSPSSKPYEQAPSLSVPFSPFSSSSRSLKLRGTIDISDQTVQIDNRDITLSHRTLCRESGTKGTTGRRMSSATIPSELKFVYNVPLNSPISRYPAQFCYSPYWRGLTA